jgi:hypothetical protein
MPEVTLLKINGNATYLTSEPFRFVFTAVDAGCCDVDRPENLVATVCGCVGRWKTGRGRGGRGGIMSKQKRFFQE